MIGEHLVNEETLVTFLVEVEKIPVCQVILAIWNP